MTVEDLAQSAAASHPGKAQQTKAEERDLPWLRHRGERSEQPVRFTLGAGGKVNRIGVAALGAVAHGQRPQIRDGDGSVALVGELAQERAIGRVESVDAAVAEIT